MFILYSESLALGALKNKLIKVDKFERRKKERKIKKKKEEVTQMINRPGVAGAVL